MRRFALFAAPVLFFSIALAGCGGSASGKTAAGPTVSVTGTFGKQPTVKIPSQKAGAGLDVKTVIHGSGPALAKTDALIGNYVVYVWSGTTHKLAQSTYTSVPALFSGKLLPGLATALTGQKVGSRVLAVIPPADGYGKTGNSQAGVKPGDTLVFVVDMIKAYAADASATGKIVSTGGGSLPTVKAGLPPAITIPKGGTPPSKLVTKILAQGTGPKVAKGESVVVQYVGAIWRTGKPFSSSWQNAAPFGFIIDSTPSQVIKGWDLGLTGQPVGSRIMLVIPPSDGYGKTGSSQAGIKGTDTLVFVVDILGAYAPGTAA
ncbi:MAG TPA: FKBP-type peptidyl-prolyl cis-trans isomerase [Streptosporangiaceae bacterium]